MRFRRVPPFFFFSFTVARQIGDTFRAIQTLAARKRSVRETNELHSRRTFSFASLDSLHGVGREKSLSVARSVAHLSCLTYITFIGKGEFFEEGTTKEKRRGPVTVSKREYVAPLRGIANSNFIFYF